MCIGQSQATLFFYFFYKVKAEDGHMFSQSCYWKTCVV